jgi:hypothetical protein
LISLWAFEVKADLDVDLRQGQALPLLAVLSNQLESPLCGPVAKKALLQ